MHSIVLSAFWMDTKPLLSSFLLAMAMIKPQNAALFLLVVLVKGRWKTIGQTAGIMIAGCAGAEVYVTICSHFRGMTGNASILGEVFTMLNNYSGGGQGKSESSTLWFFTYGILDKLIDYGISSYVVLVGSALLGILFVLLIMFYIRGCKSLYEDWIVLFSAAALGSIFWSYKTPCDEIIIILCNLLCVLYWKCSRQGLKDVLWMLFYLFCINMKVFRFWGRKMFPLELDTAIVADMILRIIVYIMMVRKLKVLKQAEADGVRLPQTDEMIDYMADTIKKAVRR